MLLRTLAFTLFTGSLLPAQIASPRPGFVRYEDRSVRAVYGIPGNLVVETSPSSFADAISFSDWGGMEAAAGSIRLLRADRSVLAEFRTDEPAPLLSAGDDPASSLAWLPASHRLLLFDGKSFRSIVVNDSPWGGTVTSVARIAPAEARLLASEANGSVSAIRVSLGSGEIVSLDTVGGVKGPAYQVGHFLLSAGEGTELVVEGPAGRQTIPFPARSFIAQRMSSPWVLLSPEAGGGQHWALHLGGTSATLSLLPATAPLRAAAAGAGR